MTGQWTLAATSSTGVMGLAVGRVSTDLASASAVGQPQEIEVFTDRRHAEEISPRLQELLVTAGIVIGDLERLVIDVGPGRFTGLRVGLATIRALGFALDIPVVGLTSLAVLAASVTDPDQPQDDQLMVTAVIDARRNEVFQQTFVGDTPVSDAVVGKPEDLASVIGGGIVVGDGLDRYLEIYQNAAANTGATPVLDRHPRAAVMLGMSHGLPGTPGTEVQPLYLRDPDAKANIKTRPTA